MIPDGFLVFFPSYIVMEDTISHWKKTKIWPQLLKLKHIVEEKRGASDFMATIREYEDAVRKPFVGKNGAIMFAVCRVCYVHHRFRFISFIASLP
jgi:Rad3-related DNA helicase